jgi:hypothetical protein
MKIGILGSGHVGQKLADGFIELGRHVREGSNFSYCLGPLYIGDTEKNLINSSTSNPRKIKQILNLIFYGLKYSKLNKKLISQDKIKLYYPMMITWSIIRVLYPQFGNAIKSNTSSLNETLDFISLIRETERGHHKSDRKFVEVAFEMLREFPTFDFNHYLRQKSAEISMWTLESLKIIAEDFKLFLFCFGLVDYFGSSIDFKTARKDKGTQSGYEYFAIINFVNDEIVHDVIKEISLF